MYIEILNSLQVLITEQQTSYMHGIFLCRWFSHVLQFTIVSGDRSMLVTRCEHRGSFFLGSMWPSFIISFMSIVGGRLAAQYWILYIMESHNYNTLYWNYAWSIIIWSNRVRIIYNRSDKYEWCNSLLFS